jgi:exodeoxyribonuclease V beta subunit
MTPSMPAASEGYPAQPFGLTGPLPEPGITVIEASAGTGKTHTLTSLVLRFVAEGTPLSAVLAVTFTKMATGELRDRVRTRLVDAHRGLSTYLRSGDRAGVDADEVLAGLTRGTASDVEDRCRRLADALADFDAATIATTHGFCQLVLHGLGTAGDTVPGTTLLEDPADLMEEVVDDLYVRRSLLHPAAEPPFSLEQARKAAFEATRNPDTALAPLGGDDECGLLRRLAEKAREEIARRLLEAHVLTYDELLHRLACTLDDPVRGPVACRRLGERYSVVLVDEFQDTDPVQWTVLRRAFGGGDTRLILIGDPKQAVYAFRGADVHAYLDAARSARSVFTLDTNRRADQPLLTATDALLSPLQFGHADIAFRSVSAPPDRQQSALRGGGPPLRWRLVPDSQKGIPMTTRSLLSKPALRDWVAGDVAADIARFLNSAAEIVEDGSARPVRQRDVAVLTRTNAQALAVRDELRAAGVASVVAGLDSVFRSDAAEAWLRLLEALQEPSSRSRAAAVALGPFIGMSQLEAATATDDRWEGVHDRLHRWASVLATRGVASLYRALTVEEQLPGRVLGVEGGERLLTDLGHTAQLLHAEASTAQLGAPSLRNWLAARIRSVADEQAEAEDRSRRLDSDAEAVQVLTIHGAKGLEFPVVYCPYLWDGGPPERASGPVIFHDPDSAGTRTLDVGCPVKQGPARQRYLDHASLARDERRGEDLRLLYVALTRARHQLVVWWARTQDCRHSPLGRLLAGRDAFTGEVRDTGRGEPAGRQIRAVLDAVAARAPVLIEIEAATGRMEQAAGRTGADGPDASRLLAAPFTRSLDLRWRRASYSSITAPAHDGRGGEPVGSEPEDPGLADEPEGAGPDQWDSGDGHGQPGAAEPSSPRSGPPSPMAGIPGGPIVGTFVHRILEQTDFAAPDLDGELARAVGQAVRRDGPVADAELLRPGLHAALTTPLGPLASGARLVDLARADRLDELGFELPVAGGDRPLGTVRTADIGDRLQAHLPAGDRLLLYCERLREPEVDSPFRGYLTGSLDLVFRRTGDDGQPRWFLADYKTNRLGGPTGATTVLDYGPDQLDAEMQSRHYPLQALIYIVALHRYLRWRQPGYEPERHLGGVLYLFLRGMAGPDTPSVGGSPCGVWSWAVPTGLVTGLSDLFETGRDG